MSNLTIEVENGFHHVYSRGNDRRPIVVTDADRFLFLDVLEETAEMYEWNVLMDVLMGNHFHLELQTPKPNLADGMRRLNSVYAKRFHREHGSRDHLFGQPYGWRLVESGEYLLRLTRYIARNPVTHGFAASPQEWYWSGVRTVMGATEPRFRRPDLLLPLFAEDPIEARARFLSFINDPVDDNDPDWLRGAIIGSQAFIDAHLPPDGKRSLYVPPPPLIELVPPGCTVDDIAAAVKHGYSQTELADFLGLSQSTISRKLSAHRRAA